MQLEPLWINSFHACRCLCDEAPLFEVMNNAISYVKIGYMEWCWYCIELFISTIVISSGLAQNHQIGIGYNVAKIV